MIDLEVQRENLAAGYPVSYSARPAGVVGLPERRSLVPSGEREPETLAFDSASDGLDLVGFDWLACTTQ